MTIVLVGNPIAKNKILKYSLSFDKIKYENQLIPIEDSDGHYMFTTDNPLKVVQLTDIHIGGGLFSIGKDKSALNAVAAMLTYEKPDLVIATGDVAYSVIFQSGTNDNRIPAIAFANLMEKLGVYWTMTFGNHDAEKFNRYEKNDLIDIYKKYDYCIFQSGPEDLSGRGNSMIKIKNSSGLTERVLVMLDSHMYKPNDKYGIKLNYENIKENQTKWYAQEIAKINDANTAEINSLPVEEQSLAENIKYKKVNSSLYFHIPLKEHKDAWMIYKNSGYKDSEKVKHEYGRIGEVGKYIYIMVREKMMSF